MPEDFAFDDLMDEGFSKVSETILDTLEISECELQNTGFEDEIDIEV